MATSARKQFSSKLPSGTGRYLPFVGLVAGGFLWLTVTELSTGVLGNFHPVDTVTVLGSLLSTPAFYDHIWISLYRFGVSLIICLAIGVPLGIAVGYFTTVHQASSIVFQLLRMISPLAWFPIALIVFGVGNGAAIFVMVMAGVWPILLNTAHGIATLEGQWIEVADSLGASTPATIRRVALPAVVPELLTGVRLSVGILWIILVPAEMLGVNTGLGYFILDARDRFAYAEIPAVMLIIGTIGYLLDLMLRRVNVAYVRCV